MASVMMYFQVHQPLRLRADFNYFSIGTGQDCEDHAQNRKILRHISDHCYLKANQLIFDLIQRHKGAFRVAYSLSGTFLEQCEKWAPDVISSFRKLAETGCVEFLSETYYHSLASVYSQKEWVRQVELHRKKLSEYLGVSPRVFRNTELIYNNTTAKWAEDLGFQGIVAEGLDHVLGWRNAQFAYRPQGSDSIKVLFRNYRLSDDIAFRFQDPSWPEAPLTAARYAQWLEKAGANGETINIFLDYETFGEHHKEADGIFAFLADLPAQVLGSKNLHFATPSEVLTRLDAVDTVDIPVFTSWADQERDLSAWLGNHLQKAAASSLYDLEETVLALNDPDILALWSRLQSSDHFYYMSTKDSDDGNVHRYFSPFKSPYDAFITYTNALNELRHRVDLCLEQRIKNEVPAQPLRTLKKKKEALKVSLEEPETVAEQASLFGDKKVRVTKNPRSRAV